MTQKLSVSYRYIQTTASFVSLDAEVSYRNISVSELVLDPDTKNRYFRSGTEATMLEQHATLFGKAAIDAFSTTDQVQSFDITKSASDAFGMGDDVHVLLEILRSFADSTSVADTQAFAVGLAKADSFGTTDVETRDFSKVATDSYTVAEAVALLFSNAYADSVSATDQFARVVSYDRSFSDSFVLDDFTDIDAIQKDTIASKTNIIGFSDIQVFGTEKLLQDTAAVTELAALHTSRPATDGVSTADAFQKVVAFSRAPAETLSFTDTTTADTSKVLADTTVVSEVFQKDVTFQRTFTDAVNFAEQSVAAFEKGLTDTASMSESVQIETTSLFSSVLNAGALNSAPLNN